MCVPGHCCIERLLRSVEASAWVLRSDCQCQLIEDDAELVMAGDVGGDVVVAAAHALHEGVTGSEDPHRPVGHCCVAPSLRMVRA